MKTILLYGFLGRQFGRVHRYDVRNPAEAVRALCATLPGFRKAVVDGGAYRVLVAGKDSLSTERLTDPVSTRESIRIVPVIAGAGRGGMLILGAIMVVAGAVITYGSAGAASPWGVGLMKYGAIMMLGGVASMLLTPKPADGPTDGPENKASNSFDGAINTAAQGNPVAVLYGGPLIIGSQVISAGLGL